MLISLCPCCSNILLRHVNSQGVYWYCSHCYQEMPNYNQLINNLETASNLSDDKSSIKVNYVEQKALVLTKLKA